MAGDFPVELRYTESDEWVRENGGNMVSGVTAFAAEQLGDVVYVELPKPGTHFAKGEAFGEIESVKAVSSLNMPLTGEIERINPELDANPGLVNDDPYGAGWMIIFRPDNPDDFSTLLDAGAYESHTLEHH